MVYIVHNDTIEILAMSYERTKTHLLFYFSEMRTLGLEHYITAYSKCDHLDHYRHP